MRMTPELLRAYVDDELDAAMREQVEFWLAEHAEDFAELLNQQNFSAFDEEFWEKVRPSMPSQESWDHVLSQIDSALNRMRPVRSDQKRAGNGRLIARVAAVASLAACLFLVIILIKNQSKTTNDARHEAVSSLIDDADDDLMFQVAKVDDVELIQLPEEAANLVVVGHHPMESVKFVLALASDVTVFNYGPDEQGNLPDLETTRGADASMIWAPRGN